MIFFLEVFFCLSQSSTPPLASVVEEEKKLLRLFSLSLSLYLSLSLSLGRPPSMADFLDAADDLEGAQTREGFEEGER